MKKILILVVLFFLFEKAKSQVSYTVRGVGKYHAYGLSTDTKPANPPNYCMFTETNTGKVFKSLNGTWSEVTQGSGVSQQALADTAFSLRSAFFVNINILSFGASENNSASANRAAIIAARDYVYANTSVYILSIPKGVYQVSDSILFNKDIRINGEGTIGNPTSELVFPEGKKGLVFSYINGQNGFGAEMYNMKITGQLTAGYNNTNVHAITIRTRVLFNNVVVPQFDGNGFHVSACALPPSGDNNNYGNADHSIFINCHAHYTTNGFFSEGCDAHISALRDCNFSQNRRYGYNGNALDGDLLSNVHFAFNGAGVPGAKSVVTYNGKYYVAKSGHDGYWGDATDSNYNKQPDVNPDYWHEVTATMIAYGEWANNVRYYGGGVGVVRSAAAWTSFEKCYSEGGQPPLFLNYRSEWRGGTNGAGVVGGAVWNTLYGEVHLYNAGMEIEKYMMVGTTTYDPSTVFKSYNDYSKTQSRVVFKGEGTTPEVYIDLKNNTGKYARFAYVDTLLKIYTKNDSLGLTINDVGVYAKKFFGDGSGLTGLAGGGDMLKANNLSELPNMATARQNLGVNTTANISNSTDKNFVTDAQLTVIGNTSNTNSGDNATNSQYSGLAASKQDALVSGTNIKSVNNTTLLGSGNIQTTGYSIKVQALTSSPTDAQTIYFGMLPKAPTTTANISKVYIRKAGTIKIAELYCYSGTAGTNEAWSIYIRVNNTTDNLIATVSAATSERVFSNTGLSIAVNAGDYIEIKSVNPTWATNPLTTIFGGYIYIE